MKIHENKDKSIHSTPKCSYCREEGHNQFNCPHVAEDWKCLSKYRLPLDNDGKVIRRGWLGAYYAMDSDPLKANVPNNIFTAWFRACQKAMNGQIERKNKAKAKRKATTRTCGYCGSTDHTRRTCPDMKQFLKDCYTANEKWRKKAYEELVVKHGISVGACVKVAYREGYGWNSPKTEKLGIITDINWDTLNLFSSCTSKSEFAHSPLTIKVMVGDKNFVVTNCEDYFRIIGSNGNNNGYYHSSCDLVSIVTPAAEKLSESWITDYKESFETLVKKKSLEILKKGMVSEYSAPNLWAHVQNWK